MILLQKEDLPKVSKKISSSECSEVYLLQNGKYLKIFNPIFLLVLKYNGIDMESKIVNAMPISNVPEIIVPEAAVYNKDTFIGYITSPAIGINYVEYNNRLSFQDLSNLLKYGREHMALEDIIKRANKEGIVFPDLLTCDNIFVNNGSFQLIDYDGIQIPGYPPILMSSGLGEEKLYKNHKYLDKNGIYNPNLDKKSLIYLYYLIVFNIDLKKVGMVDPTGNIMTLDDIFEIIGLDDQDFAHATWLAVCDKDNDNKYLEYLALKLAEEYNLRIIAKTPNGYLKKLYRK